MLAVVSFVLHYSEFYSLAPFKLLTISRGTRHSLMQSLRVNSRLLFASAVLLAGCRQTAWPALKQPAIPQPVTAAYAQHPASPPVQPTKAPSDTPKLEAIEERQGPFTSFGQAFAVVLRTLRLVRAATSRRLSLHSISSTPAAPSSITKTFLTPSKKTSSQKAAPFL